MAISSDGDSDATLMFLSITNYIFSAVFLIECVLKILAYKWAYFDTAWNRFDFFVVVSSILDIAMDNLGSDALGSLSVAPQLARVLRVLRISRVLRLAAASDGL
mmetsp:Transcript_17432/g.12443  ORF Transcript_17432/g.12443 Transcript_17432/m.12443 type:complete len:104 (-) Transcript_17432:1064-1375(-)